MELKSKRKVYLVYMFGITVFFNIFVYLYLQKYSMIDTDYSKFDTYIESVRNGKVEVTKEKFIKALDNRKTAFQSTDKILIGYHDVFKIYIGVNLFIVGLLCTTWWRELKRTNNETS